MKDKLKVAAPYLSIFGLIVLVSIPAVLWLIRQNGGTPPTWLGWALLVVGLLLALAWPLRMLVRKLCAKKAAPEKAGG